MKKKGSSSMPAVGLDKVKKLGCNSAPKKGK